MFSGAHPRRTVLTVALLLVIVFAVLSPCLESGFFPFWDDGMYLLGNPQVRSLSAKNIVNIFRTTVLDTYVPLTVLSFAVEYHFFGFDPFVYHLNNLFLHLAVTLGVFILARQMGFSFWAAWTGALLFGIHPMRVESVAWITERKDVLYACFYIAALNVYWGYLQSGRRSLFWITAGLGFLSLLAKPMALSLPLILLVLDWYARRSWRPGVLIEKAVLLIYIVPLTWITYTAFIRNPIRNLDGAFLSWIWSFLFYLRKFLWPLFLTPDYYIPQPVSLAHIEYSGSVLVFFLLLALAWRWRADRALGLAVLFYFCSIFFLLRFDIRQDYCFVADRFMYLPSLGICLWLGGKVRDLCHRRPTWLWVVAAVFLLLAIKSYWQGRLWKNNLVFWNYVIRHNPQSYAGYGNRGHIYRGLNQKDLALAEFKKSTDLYPHLAVGWEAQGNILQEAGHWPQALACYNKVIDIEPNNIKVYNKRAIVYRRMGRLDLAIKDLSTAIELNPRDPDPYETRGRLYREMGREKQAIADFRRAAKARNGRPQENESEFNRL